MKYVKVSDGVVSAYPYTLMDMRKEYANTSFPAEMGNDLLAEYGVYVVTATERPASTLTQDPVEQTPVQINGVWTQSWSMVDVSAEEAAQRQQEASDAAHAEAVKVDAFVQNFIAMTPAQVESYVVNNTANLAQVRSLLGKMALMLLALARREYR